jgi:hypothetical protein
MQFFEVMPSFAECEITNGNFAEVAFTLPVDDLVSEVCEVWRGDKTMNITMNFA